MCFLDASKAFDRVNHQTLFEKLANRGVPGYICRVLIFWYAKQQMRIRWGSSISSAFMVSNGVRQGGILSPYLFNLYVDKLSVMLNNVQSGCFIGSKMVNHLMYADDVVLLSPSSNGLRKLLNACETFASTHDVRFNCSKSVIMICRSKMLQHVPSPSFYLDNKPLTEVSSYKYLGHLLTSDMTDDADIMRQNRQLYWQGNVLLRNFYMCSIPVKCKLFETFCSSFYCAHLWTNYTKNSMRSFQTAYHNMLKKFIGLPKWSSTSYTCVMFKVKSCGETLRHFVYRFVSRIAISRSSIIQAIVTSSLLWTSRMRRSWNSMLYTYSLYRTNR